MTDPSQYFKGRTVQEQMNEVIGYVDVRAAEVATDAIAADVAQVHQDMLDADADAAAAAASAAAAAGTLANAVKKTGEASQSIAGDIAVSGDLTGGTVTVPTPVNNTDAATKKYVDDADALKISITDINSYAVGLTGNQGPILGIKDFEFMPKSQYGGSQSTGSGWFKIWESETSVQSLRRVTILNIVYREQAMYAKLIISRRNLNQTTANLICGNTSANSIIVTRDSNGKMTVWTAVSRTSGWIECETLGSNVAEVNYSQILNDDTTYTEPQAGDYVYLVSI